MTSLDHPQGLSLASKSTIPTHRFTAIEECLHQINSISDGIMIVSDISPKDYDLILKANRRHIRLRHYSGDAQTLIIVVRTPLHEQLHLGLYSLLKESMVQMHLGRSWKDIGSTTFRPEGHPTGDGGEGDSCGGPFDTRGDPEKWPTLVIEAGDSETIEALRRDMIWWFSRSQHEVKIVLLASFEHQDNSILIEHYEEEEGTTRDEAAHTRAFPCLRPVCQKSINITQNAGNPITYNVARGALRLKFKLLFERDARPGEGDIVISVADLQDYAGKVWRQVRR